MPVDHDESLYDSGSRLNDNEEIMARVALSRFKLGRLDLGGMGLVHPIPTDVYCAFELKSLWLHDNNLVRVSPAIAWARGLRQLRLYSNQLVEVAVGVGAPV